jgi:glyoxylase-like metal-dependent hydrolase (beta-lactamase superfamily II)
MRVAERWFARRRLDPQLTLFTEPHVDPLLRANLWHLAGRDRDLLVDTGTGLASLAAELGLPAARRVVAVATHGHFDHAGGLGEFAERVAHAAEADALARPPLKALRAADLDPELRRCLAEAGYPIGDELLDAWPRAGFDPASFTPPPATATRRVEEGDEVDLGNRCFRVLHLPGHSPGSIGLWEERTGTLFSGDAVYDGPLLDRLPGSSLDDYRRTMERLLALDVSVVHAGHDPSFGRDRLRAIVRGYLDRCPG